MQKKEMKQWVVIIVSGLCLQSTGHILLWSTGHPRCICMFLCHCTRVFFPCTPTINTNKVALRSTAWKCNLTFILSENASVVLGHHQQTCYPGNLGDRPWEPQYRSKEKACVLKAIKSIQYAAYVSTHLSEAYATLSTLLAVAVEMKYWPPESHLAPNWAILLLFSPFRLWLSLLQSDGWSRCKWLCYSRCECMCI